LRRRLQIDSPGRILLQPFQPVERAIEALARFCTSAELQ